MALNPSFEPGRAAETKRMVPRVAWPANRALGPAGAIGPESPLDTKPAPQKSFFFNFWYFQTFDITNTNPTFLLLGVGYVIRGPCPVARGGKNVTMNSWRGPRDGRRRTRVTCRATSELPTEEP